MGKVLTALFLALLATAAMAADVTLQWNPSEGATSYTVYYGPSTGTYTNSQLVGNVTTYTWQGLPDAQNLVFAVTASNAAGESGYSNEVWFYQVAPAPPTGLTVTVSVAVNVYIDTMETAPAMHLEVRRATTDELERIPAPVLERLGGADPKGGVSGAR